MFFISYLHDTGPWSKKTSTLCSLLLLLATFFVLEAAGKEEIVGLFEHKLLKGNKVELNKNFTFVSATSFNSATYKNISHGACDVHIKDDFIEITYHGEFCTVDLLSGRKDKIEFKTGVRSKTGGEIDCLAEGIEGSYSNVLPFIYSKDNEEINEFKADGPSPLKKGAKKCGNEEKCGKRHGECLGETSLEVSWSKDKDGRFNAYTHLIGEVEKGAQLEGVSIFDLEIMDSKGFKMAAVQHNASGTNAYCVPKENPIVKPAAWTITNHEHLSGDRLLVFSLLPPTVSRVFSKDDKITEKRGSEPKCELFIQFSTERYRLLAAIAPSTTTSTTILTTTTTTTETPSTTTTSSTTTSKPEIPKCPAVITTTCPECSKEVIWPVLFVIVFLALIGLAAAFVWFWMKKSKKEKEAETPEQLEDKFLRALYDDEAKKKGPDAVGPFDKWKDNRKKTEKGDAAQGLPPDGKDASKNKPEEAKPKTEEKSKIEQSPTTKTAIGTDKSVVDNKGKSKSAGVDVKKATSAVSAQSAKTATPDVNTPSTSGIKEQPPNVVYIDRIVKEKVFVKSDEYTIEEYSYDDDGNLKPPKIVPENEISTDSASFEGTPELI
ncbi:hypothetical protein Mgra_00007343 [Meloidogyne graminicola]|uniref:Uncharacterized protein n=1 Tax=Meloidogyne graminicola TaxID=189291 RepID=A0A8S9ZIM6_9BILA|nr:hypothetical protein Mgra_00007343 [Meloidogyne graminicola]